MPSTVEASRRQPHVRDPSCNPGLTPSGRNSAMKTSEFDYELPAELIAQEPLPERSQSRMMVVQRATGELIDRTVRDLPEYLDAGDLLVVNDTRVFNARVFGQRADTGGRVELLLVRELKPDRDDRPSVGDQTTWECMYRGSARAKDGMELILADGRIHAQIVDASGSGRVVVQIRSDAPLFDILDSAGVPPVPPYIKRKAGDHRIMIDRDRYQTVYARERGSIAAPTAGLHLDEALLKQLRAGGVSRAAVTLHVGPGTFQPVKVETVEEHEMEAELYSIGRHTAEAVRTTQDNGNRVVAVGSTTVRTLETVFGEHGDVTAASGASSIFIFPPYKFGVVDAMLTNFHLPRSTLLMMVCAFAGKELALHCYQEAVARKYRFYSYGDCMLIV